MAGGFIQCAFEMAKNRHCGFVYIDIGYEGTVDMIRAERHVLGWVCD